MPLRVDYGACYRCLDFDILACSYAYMTVAGLRLDTSPAEDPANLEGARWRPLRQTNAGFVVRHPLGL